jgi:hypothetical protein
MEAQTVVLTCKDEKESRLLTWAEEEGKSVIDLADWISRERLESPGPQDTPWSVFESTRAFFERLSERLRGRLSWLCRHLR